MARFIAIMLLFLFLLIPQNIFASSIDPQYIFVRKAEQWSDCMWWPEYNQDRNDSYFKSIINKIKSKGTAKRRLGLSVLIVGNHVPMNFNLACLQNLLDLSLQNDLPVYIAFDDYIWWDNTPELWNWWDPNQPGYNPNNRFNVEWTDWDGDTNDDHAMKISWVNWGRQVRLKPRPNLSSPAFINRTKNNLDQLIPVLRNWYNNLPANKKYLLGGIEIGNEVSIGNYLFYPNGNSYLNQNPANDPQGDLTNSIKFGYAAVKVGGIKSSGTMTSQDLNLAVKKYHQTMNSYVISLGVPRNKVYNHTGGMISYPDVFTPPNLVVNDITSTLESDGYPGWSEYGDLAVNPQNNLLLNQILDTPGITQWATPEWFPPVTDYNGWVTALRNTLNYRNNRFLNVANWDSIIDTTYAHDAIRTVLEENKLRGDLDLSGKVDIYDYANLVQNFGKKNITTFLAADIDSDGDVDIYDYATLVQNFGRTN